MTEQKNEIKGTEKKNSNKLFNIFLALAVIGTVGYIGLRLYNDFRGQSDNIEDIISTVDKDENNRKIDYYDLEYIEEQTDRDLYKSELEREPYKNESLGGGQIIITSGNKNEHLKTVSGLYQKGFLWYLNGGASLRHPEDELIEPDQVDSFNVFVNQTKALDEKGKDIILSDEEVEDYAKKAESIAEEMHAPMYYYVGELIRNLKGKNPTLSSVYYLLEANRISAAHLVENESLNYTSTDYRANLDTSYNGESQEKSLVEFVTHNIELVNKKTALVHYTIDNSMTKYSLEDWANTIKTIFYGDNKKSEDEDVIMVMAHYKDISNFFLAEYIIQTGNLDVSDDDILPSSYSFYKPAFTWCISPKIEEIATVYYDIVEPLVYEGKYTTRDDMYQKTTEKLDGKYTYDEVVSAIQTYEYWALIK